MELKEKIIQKLKEVIDPGTLSDVVGMGLIRNLNVTEDGKVSLEFQPSSPVCPLVLPLALNIQKALKTLSEIKNLKLTVTEHQMAEEVNSYLKEEME
jgi:metal-sulfur cluster biosynthetic enzyme